MENTWDNFFSAGPSQANSNEIHEVRKSRAAVVAPEPVAEDLEIPASRVQKSARLLVTLIIKKGY